MILQHFSRSSEYGGLESRVVVLLYTYSIFISCLSNLLPLLAYPSEICSDRATIFRIWSSTGYEFYRLILMFSDNV